MTRSHGFFWFLAIAIGVALRVWWLPGQVMGDDEMHAISAALKQPLASILVTYQPNDNCIPLTALFRSWLDAGWTLTELHFRMVPFGFGLFILVLPWLWRPWLSATTVVAWTALMATSHLLIGYSRIVRSYMPITALALLALTAVWRAQQAKSGRRRGAWLAVYVVSAALAGWFHLGSTPFVLAPVLWLIWTMQPSRSADRRAVTLTALGLLAGFAAFLLPAWESFWELVQGKSGREWPTLNTLGETLYLQSGAKYMLAALAFWAAGVFGARQLWREQRPLALFLALAVGSQLVAMLVLGPAGVEHPIILNRYLLVTLPIVLLAVAAAMARLGPGLPVGLAVGWIAVGSWTDGALRQSSFQHHYRYVRLSLPRLAPADVDVPAFYFDLRRDGGNRPILEYPWAHAWPTNEVVPAYQEIHGRPVNVVYRDGTFYNSQIRWRNMSHLSDDAFLENDAQYLVVHKDLAREERRLRGDDAEIDQVMRRQWSRHYHAARILISMLKSDWGDPPYEDTDLLVWDLDAIRDSHPDWKRLVTAPR